MTDGLKDWEEVKAEIERRHNATGLAGLWYKSWRGYYRARRWVTAIPREVRWAWQRVFRGWDDFSTWSLDVHLSRTLGQQLVMMADIAHGWPDGEEWDYTFETWTADLRRHGEALQLYSEGWVDDWATTGEPAQAALYWVAEHLGALWD